MVAVIILLYVTTTINLSLNLALLRFGFEDPNFDLAKVFLDFFEGRVHLGDLMNIRMLNIGIGITATMSTVVADSTMVCAIVVVNLDINYGNSRFGVAGWSGDGVGS